MSDIVDECRRELSENVEMTRTRIRACKEYVDKSIESAEGLLEALKIIQMKLRELEIHPDRKYLIYEIKSLIANIEIQKIRLKIYLKHFLEEYKLLSL